METRRTIEEEKALSQARYEARKLCQKFSKTNVKNKNKKTKILTKLFGELGTNAKIMQPFSCDYGYNIKIKNDAFINYNCTMLDTDTITIGAHCRIAPNVSFYSVYHPIDPTDRKNGTILSAPINVCDNVWIGGNSIVLAGVTIGENSIIGAGSVVTKNIPANCIAVGNPAKVIKQIKNEL